MLPALTMDDLENGGVPDVELSTELGEGYATSSISHPDFSHLLLGEFCTSGRLTTTNFLRMLLAKSSP